jgi:ABC-type microcin C transport system duplicated ATPase subunit YejF
MNSSTDAMTAGATIGAAGSVPLLQVQALGLSLPDMAKKAFFSAAPMKRILRDVSFTLEAGGTLGVIGESGSGKSTLARALTMLMQPQDGELLFQGRNVRGFDAVHMVDYRTKVQLVFQDPMSALNPRRRVRDIVCQPLRALGRLAQDDGKGTRAAAQLLERVGLSAQLGERYPTWPSARSPRKFSSCACRTAPSSVARASSPSPRRCSNAASATSPATRARRSRT